MEKYKILITGSSGAIGKTISPYLESQGYFIRGFDKNPDQELCEFIQGDIEDYSDLRLAMKGINTVIHLAACSDDAADFMTQLLFANVIGTYNILEAASKESVDQVILASSIHAISLPPQNGNVNRSTDRSPTSHYGLTKLWAEDMGEMYSRLYGLSIIAARIGWFVKNLTELEEIKNTTKGKEMFVSHNDLKRFFLCCLQKTHISFSILYALSKQSDGEIFDMQATKRLIDFEPHDTFPNGIAATITK